MYGILFSVVVTVVTKWLSILILFCASIRCTSCFVMHEIIIYLNPRLPIVEFVHSGVWIVATSDVMKFTIVCQDKSGIQNEVVYPPLRVIRLNMTCGAANGYLCLSLCYEKRLEVIFGMLGVHY